jgi:AAA15 family ATPase/GTPase
MNQEIYTGLLDFRAKNAYSFQNPLHLTLRESTHSKPEVVQEVSYVGKIRKPQGALPVLAILGANASGKSNALKAIRDMRRMVLRSFKAEPDSRIPRESFKGFSPSEPSQFEIELVIEGVWYLYGYEINDEAVTREWAYYSPNGVKSRLFEREGQGKISTRPLNKREWNAAETIVRPNALYLSACGQIEHPDTRQLFDWFRNGLRFTGADELNSNSRRSLNSFKNSKTKLAALALLQAADFGITNLEISKPDPEVEEAVVKLWKFMSESDFLGVNQNPSDNQRMPQFEDKVRFSHKIGEEVLLFDSQDESDGTKAWFNAIGWVLSALTKGGVLIIDEFGASLHSNLILEIIRLFQDPKINTKFAQLIFTSHSLIVLAPSPGGTLLGRDQILIAEKNNYGASTIFPLSDLSVRNDEPIMKRYMEGIYGGIPILDFERFSAALNMESKT